jgi:hypothetical protein
VRAREHGKDSSDLEFNSITISIFLNFKVGFDNDFEKF